MKILIIATVRTGGKQLSEWIAKELNYSHIHEPQRDYQPNDNEVVKHLTMSIVDSHTKIYDDFDPTIWDKIITLKRTDIREGAESMSFAEKTKSFHSTYSIPDKWVGDNGYNIGENEVFISRLNSDIDKIEFECLKLTYEGIYKTGEEIPKLKEYLGITNPQHLHMLDNRFKYRKNLL